MPRVAVDPSLLFSAKGAAVIRGSQQFQKKKNLVLEPLTDIVRSESVAISQLGVHYTDWEDFSLALGDRTGYIEERRGPWW
jgi:hypothetical protein